MFRRRAYGPFDYQWSHDLRGIEFTSQSEKFAEVCSCDEFYADLRPWALPLAVCRAAAVTAAMIARSIPVGLTDQQRAASLADLLHEHDVGGFAVRLTGGL